MTALSRLSQILKLPFFNPSVRTAPVEANPFGFDTVGPVLLEPMRSTARQLAPWMKAAGFASDHAFRCISHRAGELDDWVESFRTTKL